MCFIELHFMMPSLCFMHICMDASCFLTARKVLTVTAFGRCTQGIHPCIAADGRSSIKQVRNCVIKITSDRGLYILRPPRVPGAAQFKQAESEL